MTEQNDIQVRNMSLDFGEHLAVEKAKREKAEAERDALQSQVKVLREALEKAKNALALFRLTDQTWETQIRGMLDTDTYSSWSVSSYRHVREAYDTVHAALASLPTEAEPKPQDPPKVRYFISIGRDLKPNCPQWVWKTENGKVYCRTYNSRWGRDDYHNPLSLLEKSGGFREVPSDPFEPQTETKGGAE